MNCRHDVAPRHLLVHDQIHVPLDRGEVTRTASRRLHVDREFQAVEPELGGNHRILEAGGRERRDSHFADHAHPLRGQAWPLEHDFGGPPGCEQIETDGLENDTESIGCVRYDPEPLEHRLSHPLADREAAPHHERNEQGLFHR